MKRLLKFPSIILLFLIVMVLQVTAVNAANNHKVKTLSNTLNNKVIAATMIDVWYGPVQTFGAIGTPQDMINILGNVISTTTSLTYTLNSSSPYTLTIGDDGVAAAASSFLGVTVPSSGLSEGEYVRPNNTPTDKWLSILGVLADPENSRLIEDGDFNIEIFLNDLDLVEGANTVLITASDGSSSEQASVTVNYSSSSTWPLPYTIDWSTVTNIQDVAQIVDGEWEIVDGQVKPTAFGYDRLLAIGDLDWDDYEVVVPVTIHAFPVDDEGGVGIVARWQGHGNSGGEQPGTEWWHIGAYAYYRVKSSDKYVLRTNQSDTYTVAHTLTEGTTYYFKMRVQTDLKPNLSKGKGYFSFKVWEVGTPEPSDWIFEQLDDTPDDLSNGSALLVAHKVDASFGNVVITPILDVVVTDDGHGTATVDPDLDELNPNPDSDAYLYGDVITVTAEADSSFIFTGWSGDLSGLETPTTITLTQDMNITATFALPQELTITTIGAGGSVSADPLGVDGPTTYGQGTVVTLTATPIAGWSFAGWSDNLSGTNPIKTITMDTNKYVTATFIQDQYTLTTNIVGDGDVSPTAGTYTYGEEVTLTATPATDWQFTGWSGDLSGQVNPNTFMVYENTTITATFQKGSEYTIYLPFIINN